MKVDLAIDFADVRYIYRNLKKRIEGFTYISWLLRMLCTNLKKRIEGCPRPRQRGRIHPSAPESQEED